MFQPSFSWCRISQPSTASLPVMPVKKSGHRLAPLCLHGNPSCVWLRGHGLDHSWWYPSSHSWWMDVTPPMVLIGFDSSPFLGHIDARMLPIPFYLKLWSKMRTKPRGVGFSDILDKAWAWPQIHVAAKHTKVTLAQTLKITRPSVSHLSMGLS